jgi:DNA-binding transcriptional regulator YiaG
MSIHFVPGGARPPRYPAFGREFDLFCDRSAMTTSRIARSLGVSPDMIQTYRRGHSRPNKKRQAILDALANTSFTYA